MVQLVNEENKQVDTFPIIDNVMKESVRNAPEVLLCKDQVRMMNDTEWSLLKHKKFVLASYPGSGNTFTRLVLETCFGYFTGSFYKDPMLQEVFAMEGAKEEVLFIKTHYPCGGCWTKPDGITKIPEKYTGRVPAGEIWGVVYVVRNPFKSILAEFQRRATKVQEGNRVDSHTQTVVWSPNTVSLFESEFDAMLERWIKNYQYYLRQSSGPTLVVPFEAVENASTRSAAMLKIAEFVNSNVGFIVADPKRVAFCSEQAVRHSETFLRHKSVGSRELLSSERINLICTTLIKSGYWRDEFWGNCFSTKLLV